jgi:two-component system LytT family response regulator
MKCLIVDDDPVLCDLISHFVSKVDFLEFSVSCNSGTDALNLLSVEKFDLVFLDIEMPDMTGIEVLQNMKPNIPVIMTTSNKDFALESYNYNVVDYLIKPVNFARFFKAVQKVHEQIQSKKEAENKPGNEEIFLKDGHNLVKLNLHDILFIEAVSNYMSFKTTGKTILSLISMKKLEESLPSNFVRTHRSYIVNINKIDKIEGGNLLIGEKYIPISSSYQEQLFQRLNLLM